MILRSKQEHPDDTIYEVEVLGVLPLPATGTPRRLTRRFECPPIVLVFYKITAHQIYKTTGPIHILTMEEFEAKFKDYEREEK